MYQVAHYINGQTVTSSGNKADLYNPATGEKTGQILLADSAIINKAVVAAKSAFPAWAVTTCLKRTRILFKFKSLLEEHLEELAELVTKEHGKSIIEARGSVQRGIDIVEYACGAPELLKGSYSENVGPEMDCYSIRQPLGVCVGITPFNFPAMIGLWMFPLAVTCGNTFIWKPSEKDPSCSIRIAELAKEAGYPDGVINVVQGDKESVDLLLAHKDIKAVSFVGSSIVAENIYKTAAAYGKRVQAFGGAKNHAVVMPDADLDLAVDSIVNAAFGSAGERCMAISVVVAVGDADKLISKFKPKIEKLNIDPLVTEAHLKKVLSYIDLGIKEGAELVLDGRNNKSTKGFNLSGCLFDKVKSTMKIYQEEIFGPVLCIVRVPDFKSALELVNEHEYGNGTAIFTRDGYTARTFAEKVQVGMVGINVPVPVPVPYHGFGGWKRSMFGDIGMYGHEGVNFYTQLKKITERYSGEL